MSTHSYTRKNAGGGYANPSMGDPDLTSLVKTALPGKAFRIRCQGTNLSIVFDATLTAGEITILDSEYTAWSPVVPPLPPPQTPLANFEATAPPSVTDDADAGYSVGSLWVDKTNGKAYICLDDTVGAAVWKDTTTVAGVLGTWLGPWVTATAYVVDDAVENAGGSYICTSAHTSGATDEPGVGASWATKWDLVAAKGTETDPNEVTATTTTSTTSATHTLLNGMTATPAAGTYKFTFSSSGMNADNDQECRYALFKDGVIAQHSERRLVQGGTHVHPLTATMQTQAVFTVNGSEAVEVRYHSDGTDAFTVYDRSLCWSK